MRRRPAVLSAIFVATFLSTSSKIDAQPGNRHPLARAEFDAGLAAPETRLEHMILVLQSNATQERELDALLAAQQDPESPLYHQWLTPESFGERFGASPQDIGRIVSWLGAQGFSVDELPAGGRTIVFSGTAAQVQTAFQTAMHRYRVGGQMHLANASDPRMPEALAGVARGIVSLHDFRRRAMHTRLQAAPQYSDGGYYYLAPGDFATIYDVASLYGSGLNGAGQSLAIVARCNIPMSDVETFRQTFGLSGNNPTIIVNGTDPGITSEDELSEADLDVQWSGAVAPQATVDFVVSASTNTTDGVDLSAQYIVSHNTAPVMSTSFGSCEQYMGTSELAFYNSLWQQAAAQGITALVAAGDSGAAGCDSGSETVAAGGQAVNGLCSTPYSVCVGGSEFNEGPNPGQYWSAGNGANYASALGYIPEMVWNESGSNAGYQLWAGGGGASAYYAKPTWQTGPGVPADGLRDVPDVSLTAAGHDCYMMFLEGSLVGIAGTSAASPSFAGLMALVNQHAGSGQGNANTILYALASLQASGGRAYFHDIVNGNNSVPGLTGFSAGAGYDQASGLGSVDAAILVNHWSDASSPGTPGFSLGVTPGSLTVAAGASGAVSAQVTVSGGFSAGVALSATGLPAGATAVFSPSGLTAPTYGSSTLTITVPSSAAAGAYSVTVTAAGGSVVKTASLALTVSVTAGCTLAASVTSFSMLPSSSATTEVSCGSVTGGFGTALNLGVTGAPPGVTFTASPTSVAPGSAQSKVTIATAGNVSAGSYKLSLTATGGGLSLSLPMSLTISPVPTFTMSVAPTSVGISQGSSGHVTITTVHVGSFNSSVALSVTGLPTGVTASFAPASIAAPGDGSSTLTLQAIASAPAGTHNLTVKGVGANVTDTLTLPLTIQAPPGFQLAAASKTLTVGQGVTAAVNVTTSSLTGGFNSPVALSLAAAGGGSLPRGLNAGFTPATIAAPGSGTSILAFAPDSTSTPGNYSLTITAQGGGVTQTAPLALTVTAAKGFTLHAAASSLNVLVGGAAGTQITSAALNGFTSTVALSAGTLPAGVVVTFAPASVSGNGGVSTINVQAASGATPGSYTLTVSGQGGNATATATIALNVAALAVTLTPTALTVKRGSSGSVGITTKVTGTYSGSVALSAAGLPKGVTASFSPATIGAPAAGSSTLTLTAASTTVAGGYPITIHAVSGGLTQSAALMLTVE